jgi:hypothetical protein
MGANASSGERIQAALGVLALDRLDHLLVQFGGHGRQRRVGGERQGAPHQSTFSPPLVVSVMLR